MNYERREIVDHTIEVVYHNEDGSWWAESDDVPGFSALASTLSGAQELVRESLAARSLGLPHEDK